MPNGAKFCLHVLTLVFVFFAQCHIEAQASKALQPSRRNSKSSKSTKSSKCPAPSPALKMDRKNVTSRAWHAERQAALREGLSPGAAKKRASEASKQAGLDFEKGLQ